MVLNFLKCVAKVLLKAGVNAVTFNVGGDVVDELWNQWSRDKDAEQRRKELECLAQLTPKQAQQQAIAAVTEEAGRQPAEVQQMLTTYLAQIPAHVRRSLRRPSDPTGTTVTPDLVPQRADDLKPLLPERLPRFRPGERPLPGVPWLLEEILGVGGFGEVWKAKHPDFPGMKAALKFCLDPAMQERLLHHEAKIVMQVQLQSKRHPGFVELRQFYRDANPPCLEYEYIDGGELTDWFPPRAGNPDQANRILLQLARVVGFAHVLDPAVVHRDLKPANILVTKTNGKVSFKIADFGIGGLVHHASRPASNSRLTMVANAYTQLYASPQQRGGEPARPQDDVYSLGVIWHQLLAGNLSAEPPHGRGWRQRFLGQGMDGRILDLLESCLEDEPGHRPADGKDLAARLSSLLHEPPETRSEPQALPLPPVVLYPADAPIPEALPVPKRPAPPSFRPLKPEGSPPIQPIQPIPPERPKQRSRRFSFQAIAMLTLLLCFGSFAIFMAMLASSNGPPSKSAAAAKNAIKDMKFALVPKGTFWMSQNGANAQKEVPISQDFYLGVYEVTQEEWQAVMGNNPSYFSRKGGGADKVQDFSEEQLKRFPVENVSWNDIMNDFLPKLNALEKGSGWLYRLPTEAEWEYACRGGATSKDECLFDFYLKDGPTNALSSFQANFRGDNPAGGAALGPSLKRTTKVGSYPQPNKLGLYDMHGNVWEWCDDSYYGPSPRVIRGGSWVSNGEFCRAAYRYGYAPSNRYYDLGFRLARVPSGG